MAIITFQQTFTWFIIPLLQRLFGGDSGSQKYRVTAAWQIIKCIVYLLVGLGIVSLIPVNPSLAVTFAVPLIPICIISKPSKSFITLVLQSILLFTISPPILLAAYGLHVQSLSEPAVLLNELLENWNTFGNLLLPWIIWFYWPIILALQLLVTMAP